LSMYNLRAEGVQFVRRYCSACAPRAVQLARRIQRPRMPNPNEMDSNPR